MQKHQASHHNYLLFAINMLLSLVAMYFVMFSMIDGWEDFRHNVSCTWP